MARFARAPGNTLRDQMRNHHQAAIPVMTPIGREIKTPWRRPDGREVKIKSAVMSAS